MVELTEGRRKKLVAILKEHNLITDEKAFDYDAYWDISLGEAENLNNIASQFGFSIIKQDFKAQEKQAIREGLRQEEAHANAEFEKSLVEISQNTTPQLEKYFGRVNEFVKIVAAGHSSSLLLLGDTGVGKTTSVMNTLIGLGLKYDEDFTYINGVCSPLETYHLLYKHKDKKIILIDDVPINDERTLAILKSALYGINGRRICQYHSTSEKLQVPASFELNAGVIFCCNYLPDNADFRAFKSRCLYYTLEFSHQERIKILFELAKIPYKSLTYAERREIAEFISQNSQAYTREVNFRTLFKFYELACYDRKNYRELAGTFLEADEDLLAINEIIADANFDTAKKRVDEFVRRTGKCRAVFYQKSAELLKRKGQYRRYNRLA